MSAMKLAGRDRQRSRVAPWRLNVLVNNAGVAGPFDAADPLTTRLADWRGISRSTSRECSRLPRGDSGSGESGRRLDRQVSSAAGLLPAPNAVAYGASKAAVRHLTQAWRSIVPSRGCGSL